MVQGFAPRAPKKASIKPEPAEYEREGQGLGPSIRNDPPPLHASCPREVDVEKEKILAERELLVVKAEPLHRDPGGRTAPSASGAAQKRPTIPPAVGGGGAPQVKDGKARESRRQAERKQERRLPDREPAQLGSLPPTGPHDQVRFAGGWWCYSRGPWKTPPMKTQSALPLTWSEEATLPSSSFLRWVHGPGAPALDESNTCPTT